MVSLRAATTLIPSFLLLLTPAHAKLPLWPWKPTLGTDGCGTAHSSGFNNDTDTHWILSSGIKRYYGVYVPKSYSPNTATTLVFDYHASTKTPWDQYDNSQFYASTTGGQNYLVVYPQGVNFSWQGASYANSDVNDLEFTSDLLAHIQSQYCVDRQRIYASGKSNGAGFVNTLACSDNGNAFAAFAMASAALYTDTSESDCSYKRAILESHGDKDTTVPYKGGSGNGGQLPNIDKWVSWWGQRTCGASTKAATSNSKGYTTTTYSCGSWQDAVQHYEVASLGHCWPSSDGENYDATSSPDICSDEVLDFTAQVVAFFGQWTMSTAPGPQ